MKEKSVYETLSSVDLKGKTKEKGGQTYLPWAIAWGEVKERYPDASYRVLKDEQTGLMYKFSEGMGYYVETEVTISGETLPMWLPVMDHNNEAMLNVERTVKRAKWVSGQRKSVDVKIAPANMFDINTTIMRCLVKNIAMFGLGAYIYEGEDAPTASKEPIQPAAEPAKEPAKGGTGKNTKKKPLKVGDESWDNVVAYAKTNAGKGVDFIINKLRSRFTISAAVKRELEKAIL